MNKNINIVDKNKNLKEEIGESEMEEKKAGQKIAKPTLEVSPRFFDGIQIG